jgi:hypothetical protein
VPTPAPPCDMTGPARPWTGTPPNRRRLHRRSGEITPTSRLLSPPGHAKLARRTARHPAVRATAEPGAAVLRTSLLHLPRRLRHLPDPDPARCIPRAGHRRRQRSCLHAKVQAGRRWWHDESLTNPWGQVRNLGATTATVAPPRPCTGWSG